MLEIRTLRMPRLYDMAWTEAAGRWCRAICASTVDERVDAQGEVAPPLDPAEAERAVRRLLDEGVQAIAVCLLHSYANPAHERLLKEIIAPLAPDLPLCDQLRRPARDQGVRAHLDHRDQRLSRRRSSAAISAGSSASLERIGVRAPLLLMQSNGGLTTPRQRRGPAHAHRRIRARPPAWSAPRPWRARSASDRRSSPSTWAARRRRPRSSRTAR